MERRSFLFSAAAALGALDRVRRSSSSPPDESDVDRRTLDRAFAPLAAQERRWLSRHDVPVGTSLLVLATKPRP